MDVIFAIILFQLVILPVDITQLGICHAIRNAADSSPEMRSVELHIVLFAGKPKHDVELFSKKVLQGSAKTQNFKREGQHHLGGFVE